MTGWLRDLRLSCSRTEVRSDTTGAQKDQANGFVHPEAVVRFTNNGPTNLSVHVHGQYNRAPFDGWAGDLSSPGQYKDYYYPNAQNARTIWYHVSLDQYTLATT